MEWPRGAGSSVMSSLSAVGDPELLADQVDAGGLLGHRVLHLQPGVHLEERDQAVLADQVLDGAGAVVMRLLADALGRLVDLLALCVGEERSRGLLDQLLEAALQRAVTSAGDHHIAVLVGDHLCLDVARLVQVALDEAFRRGRTPRPPREVADSNSSGISSMVRATFIPRPPPPNAALIATGTPYSLAKATTSSASLTGSGVPGTNGAWARAAMWRAVTLSPRSRDGLRARPDPDQPGVEDSLGELGVLRQEAVAGVDGVAPDLAAASRILAKSR